MIRAVALALLMCLPGFGQSLDDPPPGIRVGLRMEQARDVLAVQSIDDAPGFVRIPIVQWPDLIAAKHNASWWVWEVYNQGQVGSCAAESCTGGVAIVREMSGLPRVRFNPYGMYHKTSGGSDRGSTLQANLAHARDIGCFPEDIWPRSKGWRTKPSDEAYRAAANYRIEAYYRIPSDDWEAFGSALLQGYCVYWGYSGHAIVGVDLVSQSTFRYLNSWGNWGSASPHNSRLGYGFGVIDRSRIMWGYGAYAFQSVVPMEAPTVVLDRLSTYRFDPFELAISP